MNVPSLAKFPKRWVPWPPTPELQKLVQLTAGFGGLMLVFALHRHFTFYTSYDHGLFNQLFWNTLHGRFFQSSLTAANSVGVIEDGKIPIVSFIHLGQHFVIDFLLWLPFYALWPDPATLVVLQVGLAVAGGVVLYYLARHHLPPALALWITAAYYSASAVIGPTLDNFYEQSQIPLFGFGTLLALERRRWGWFWLLALLTLGIREDAGLITFSFGLYCLLSRRYPRVGLLLCGLSFAYVTTVTNTVMPLFSDDNGRLYLADRFRQFVNGNPSPSTMQVLWGILTQPVALLSSLVMPLEVKLFYLFRQGLPLAFISFLSPATLALTAAPLFSLLIQSGEAPMSISLRYSLAVVPGLFYGAVLWWSVHDQWWSAHGQRLTRGWQRFWRRCLVLSVLMAVLSNPHQAFYFLVPDSYVPWVHISLVNQWQHSAAIRTVLRQIPPQASVSASTFLIPPLSTRRAVMRLPTRQFQNDQGALVETEFWVADLWRYQQYLPAFKRDRQDLNFLIQFFQNGLAAGEYGLVDIQDGVVLLAQGRASNPAARDRWQRFVQEAAPGDRQPPPRHSITPSPHHSPATGNSALILAVPGIHDQGHDDDPPREAV